MRRTALAVAAVSLLVSLAFASSASAQASVKLEVMVCLASDQPGDIDPRASRIHKRLSKDVRYESLRVLDSSSQRVAVDSVMTVPLPNGKQARVRPMSVDKRGALLAVDIEGSVKVDARAKSGHLLVFNAGRHADGKLVVSIEPRF